MSLKLKCLMLACFCGWTAAAGQTVVHKVADSFEPGTWAAYEWNKAGGTVRFVDDAPTGLKRSLEVEARFSGKGFEFFQAAPVTPLVIPGDLKTVTLWFKGDGRDFPCLMKFEDGWGRDKVDGKNLDWTVGSGKSTTWQKATFTVPRDWVRPIRILGVATHNWARQTAQATVGFWVAQLEVDTDIADVDPTTGEMRSWKPDPSAKEAKPPRTPLLDVQVSSAEESNVFSKAPPAFTVSLRSWKPGTVAGSLAWKLLDSEGRLLKDGQR
ncbi:MAG: hypothetical protein FJ279_19090, partial [Planctomycetes bacterium]|nr:hypothetical protein [Planctomycetota bacterium]